MNFWVAQGGYETDPSMRDTSRYRGHPTNQIASAACFSSSYDSLERCSGWQSIVGKMLLYNTDQLRSGIDG